MTLKIHLSSDLHLEFHRNRLPDLPKEADVIVLAGDIHVGDKAYEVVREVAKKHPNAQVLFVPGNHEYYHAKDWRERYADYHAKIARIPNAHCLEKATVDIGDIRFIGTTLWTGFDGLPRVSVEEAMDASVQVLADFLFIGEGEHSLNPIAMARLYQENRDWLDTALIEARTAGKRTVVVTHFPPCLETEHQRIARSPVTAYFQANCDGLIHKYQPELWLFGHNHWNTDMRLGGTRLVSNHGGYPDEVDDYDPSLLIEV